MSERDDGGQAFPEIRIDAEFSPGGEFHLRSIPIAVQGMSLRDWFAGHALGRFIHVDGDHIEHDVCLAYQYADAMLAARSTPTTAKGE